MNHETQKNFLTNLAVIMLRDLIVYRAGIEYFKRNPSDSFDGVDAIMIQARRDPAVRAQLGTDFRLYLEGILQSENADPRAVLEKFVTEWFPQSVVN
jgi:hypothetical protein